AERELTTLARRLSWHPGELQVEDRSDSLGPGNVVMAEVQSAEVTELFTAFGKKGVPAEAVAHDLADEVEAYLAAEVPVGPHLADQLLLPLALAGGGSFVTTTPTPHTRSQMTLIPQFLNHRIEAHPTALRHWRVSIG
ncbi:MAG TPA: RNA 3'-terminal phosphate cyclase, partial [Polyangia bacterium]